jgi:hypothetical protein
VLLNYRRLTVAAACTAFLLTAGGASAQNWSFDARSIALGSAAREDNLASKMVADDQHDRSIVLPFGLIQLFGEFDRLNPSNDHFDLLRTVEYAASPVHYTFGRATDDSGDQFVVDVRAGHLSRDLHQYAGFAPANQPRAEGLAFPKWGRTFVVRHGAGGAYHGVFVGAGPYLSMQSDLNIDQQLIDILESGSIPNARMDTTSDTRAQMAFAIIGGYRGRFSLPDSTSERDGLYVAVNYNVLRGLRYEDVAVSLRLDTDNSGLIALNPPVPSPLLIARDRATSGTGRSIDIGTAVVVNRWQVGLGINGVGNRIDWTGVTRTTYGLANLLSGDSAFIESLPQLRGDARVKLPIDYRGQIAYDADAWSAVGDVGHGFGGSSFHGGGEYRMHAVAVRGGAMFSRQLWNPTAGIGLNITARTALDLAIYGNAANVEHQRRPAIAVSLRLIR